MSRRVLVTDADHFMVLWWLSSDGASYLYGAVIPTDGGWTL